VSHGGLTLAKYLRKRDKNIEIIIVEKQEKYLVVIVILPIFAPTINH